MGSEFSPVTLLDPDGQEYIVRTAVEMNNLIWGRGYTVKDDKPAKRTEGTGGSKAE